MLNLKSYEQARPLTAAYLPYPTLLTYLPTCYLTLTLTLGEGGEIP